MRSIIINPQMIIKEPKPLNATQIEVLEYIKNNHPTISQLCDAFKFRVLDICRGLRERGYVYTDHKDGSKLKTRMGDDL